MKIPYSGGWRNDYAKLAESLGFEAYSAGSSVAVRHNGVFLDTLPITRQLDLEIELPKALLRHKKKLRDIAEQERQFQERKGRTVTGLTDEELVHIHKRRTRGSSLAAISAAVAIAGF